MQALWMVLASLLFATMGVCVKYASAYFSAELVLSRYRGRYRHVAAGAIAGREPRDISEHHAGAVWSEWRPG
jgi:hypothetical protein